jgi:hypothetical protein
MVLRLKEMSGHNGLPMAGVLVAAGFALGVLYSLLGFAGV